MHKEKESEYELSLPQKYKITHKQDSRSIVLKFSSICKHQIFMSEVTHSVT